MKYSKINILTDRITIVDLPCKICVGHTVINRGHHNPYSETIV